MSIFKKISFICLICMGLCLHAAAQEASVMVSITLNDGTEQQYLCNADARLSFANNQDLVIVAEGNTISIPLSQIRKVNFSETEAVAESAESGICLWPNPTRNEFTIKGIDDGQTMRIFSQDGRLVLSQTVNEGQHIDLSHLEQGLYFINLGKRNLKLIKL